MTTNSIRVISVILSCVEHVDMQLCFFSKYSNSAALSLC